MLQSYRRLEQQTNAIARQGRHNRRQRVDHPAEDPPIIVDPYRVLQVRRDATLQEIRLAYRRLSLWHHPGRSISADAQERQRRLEIFEVVAACYETLLDKESRRRCDSLLKELEQAQAQRWTGDVRVGQIRQIGSSPMRLLTTSSSSRGSGGVSIPNLMSVSSSSSLGDLGLKYSSSDDRPGILLNTLPESPIVSRTPERSHSTKWRGKGITEPLHLLTCGGLGDLAISNDRLPSKGTSTSTESAPVHYSETETNRLFGGPLQLLYRSRRWRPFTDAKELFSNVFGNDTSLSNLPEKRWDELSLPSPSKRNTTELLSPASAWRGSTETMPDGSIVYTTQRRLNDRILTRTETVKADPETGKKHSFISVTSETIDPDAGLDDESEDASCLSLEFCMFFCSSVDEESSVHSTGGELIKSPDRRMSPTGGGVCNFFESTCFLFEPDGPTPGAMTPMSAVSSLAWMPWARS